MNHPKLYSKYNDLQKNDNLFVLDNFLCLTHWRKEGETVLDVGSGDGRFAIEFLIPRLPLNFGKYVGCDNSMNMVHFSKEIYANGKIDFMYFDISSNEIPEELVNEFDHVFSFYTLHWIKKQRQAFRNIFRFLKPGGDILLTFLASNPIYDVYKNMAKNRKWKPYSKIDFIAPYHGSSEPEKQLRKLISDNGFEVHVCKTENRIYTFPNMEIWRKSVMAVNAIIPTLRDDEIADYMKDFETEVRKLECVTIENLNNNEETIQIRYNIFVVHATKPLKII